MLTLPPQSLTIIAGLPLPDSLQRLPDNFALRAIVWATSAYPSLVPDLNKPSKWAAFKASVGRCSDALKITNSYIGLYEHDDSPIGLLSQCSFMRGINRWLARRFRQAGFGNLVHQRIDEADPAQVVAFVQMIVGDITDQAIQSADDDDDWDELDARANCYWRDIHSTLPLKRRQRVERDLQRAVSLLFYVAHNAIAVMAYGMTLSSLVQRVLSGELGAERDRAMCMAVRIDNNLREHPQFKERYLLATRTDDAAFLSSYNNTTPPLAGGVRYRGLYFLFAMLDCYGFQDRLSNRQILSLCDHARLDRWGNRIEDEGYLAKRRAEYRRHKFQAMSRH